MAALLCLLSAWAIGYEASLTLAPVLGGFIAFRSFAPDILFGLAGLLLLVRGARGESGWMAMGIGALCWAAGDVYWSVKLATLSSPPVPSWADVGYLAFCPCSFVGILSLVRRRLPRVGRTLVLDASAAALAAGALSAAVVVHPVLVHASGGALAVATNLAYPLNDLLLLALIVAAIALSGWQLDRMWGLLAAAVVAFSIADSLYLVADATNSYQQTQWFNALWYCSPVLAAWAAWFPPSKTAFGTRSASGMRGLVMLVAFASGALAILVWSSFDYVGIPAIVLASCSLLVIMGRLVLTWRENARLLRVTQTEAITDALTGLRNRRALLWDLHDRMDESSREFALLLFDLDGFKYYNDNFGHLAGDALLQRLAQNLATALGHLGHAYRMGGDEFCALIDRPGSDLQPLAELAAEALSETGEGFTVGCSYGGVHVPAEADDAAAALRIADQRLYAFKRRGRSSASSQSKDVLLRAQSERDPELGDHVRDVAELATAVALRCGLSSDGVEQVRQAAELHDVGKMAIPDAILAKAGPLDRHEWEFVRRHPVIGERILAAAPALQAVAGVVRSSHENFDGTGYPDGLVGQAIPLGSRIVAVCDAFHAMTTDRSYREAMTTEAAIEELRRCAGVQFDPEVVERFSEALTEQHELVEAGAL